MVLEAARAPMGGGLQVRHWVPCGCPSRQRKREHKALPTSNGTRARELQTEGRCSDSKDALSQGAI
jgi:hypothetical protein